MENTIKKCIQCGATMENSYGNESWAAPFCENASCPNYLLLQVGVEITIPSQDTDE